MPSRKQSSLLLRKAWIACAAALACWAPANANSAKRDPAVRREFQRLVPCPSTGKTRGRCDGFQVDHRIPLCFYGVDHPWNMQWLSVRDHREKTKLDVKVCKWDGK